MKKLICMTCYYGMLDGTCCNGYDDPDKCNKYQKQYICEGGLARDEHMSCHECVQTCVGCLKKRVEFGLVKREKVAHLLKQEKHILERRVSR